MGREAVCQCRWADESGSCRVLLEPRLLVLRGEIRRRIDVAAVTDIHTQGGELIFQAGRVTVGIMLGSPLAETWARAMAAPPPTPAKKLGISKTTRLLFLDHASTASRDLESALESAGSINAAGESPDLAIAGVSTPADLQAALGRCASLPCPLWIVYPKGRGHLIDENFVRTTLRRQGWMDTKVASISPTLTALRFTHGRGA